MDCLKLELPGVVSDSTLRKLDEWVIHVNAPAKNRSMEIHAHGLSGNEEIEVRIVGDGVLYADNTFTTELGKTTTLSANDGWVLYLGEGEYDIYLTNKYKITYIRSIGDEINYALQVAIDCRFLAYQEYWAMLDLNGVKLNNFDKYAINKLYDVRLYNCLIGCDISLFVENLSPSVTITRFILSNDATITGNAPDLGGLPIWQQSPNGTIISVRKSATLPDQDLHGTYDQFCDKAFTAGKISGTLRVHMPDDPVADDPYLVTFSSNGWTR